MTVPGGGAGILVFFLSYIYNNLRQFVSPLSKYTWHNSIGTVSAVKTYGGFSFLGEVAQQLSALAALAEDLCLVPSAHISSSQAPLTPAPGDQMASSEGTCVHMHTHQMKMFLRL